MVATQLVDACAGALVVVSEHAPTGWGRAVRDELARRARNVDNRLLLVVLTDDGAAQLPVAEVVPAKEKGSTSAVELDIELAALGVDDVQRWWSAMVQQDDFVRQDRFSDLANLDRWWESTRRCAPDLGSNPSLSDEAAQLLDFAVHAHQALSPAQRDALLGTASSLAGNELVDAAVATITPNGYLVADDDILARPLTPMAKRQLAQALSNTAEGYRGDSWSLMRAAELHASLGEVQLAEAKAFEALNALGDAVAREDLWRRWDGILQRMTEDAATQTADVDQASSGGAPHLERFIRATEQALSLGDGDRADRLARRAMSIAGDDFEVLLLHGRASHAQGDATTAALSLTRAIAKAGDEGERAQACALMAQVRYTAGDVAQASRYANEAIKNATDAETRLDGRNVIGKLLLAKEAWAEAEQHFASDAYDSNRAGNRQYELRARLNRAISLLYLGRREQAREMLQQVAADAERYAVPRALGFALSNLATVAILEHQYEHALGLSERAIEMCRRFEPRSGLVLPVTILVELRLRLGLVDEAEHGLRFGIQTCGPSLPLSLYAHFAKVNASIQLLRGSTSAAAREIATAISGATCAADLPLLAQCHRVAAEIALYDGDVARARTALDAAGALRHTLFGNAELAVLEAECARQAGEPYKVLSREALVLAQQAADTESLRNAHLLLFHAYRGDGDDASAQSHLRAAVGERDKVAHSLSPSLRQQYLRRRTFDEIRELELSTAFDAPETERSVRVPKRPVGGQARAGESGGRKLAGDSPPIRALRGTIKRIAATDATVLISGPTGSGKELVAEAVHRASAHADGPLVKVNCAALVETLLLSELFGHEKGAFTGASTRRRGRFEVAEGGTLFLDEIGDISPRTQVALLRVLQDGTFERVGGCSQLRANVRIVCATHRDLPAMVERGEFRQDLYYRLCGVVLEVPSLQERISDLPLLVTALLGGHGTSVGSQNKNITLSRSARHGLARHNWPGNVRELENALRVATLFAADSEIELADFTDNVESLRYLASETSPASQIEPARPSGSQPADAHDSLPPPSSSTDLVYAEIRTGTKLADMKRKLEQECIARALVESGGNITRAAALLGMKRPRLSQLVKQYKLASVLEDIKS